jgi:signal transduction histidine kinase
MQEATARISGLVAAVRAYSQLDRASVQLIDVSEGIESTLVILRHKSPDGVTIVRDYDPNLLRIEANTAQLNQVWTNLIDNALDATSGAGTLRLHTRSEEDAVVVEVIDDGPGMTPEVQIHAFEPFFTTKDVGKGTGLGLDMSRRIVHEQHHGDISIQSRPARRSCVFDFRSAATGTDSCGTSAGLTKAYISPLCREIPHHLGLHHGCPCG